MKQIIAASRFAPAALACAGLLLGATSAAAADVPMEKVEQAVKYRQNVMSTMSGLAGTAVGQLRDGFSYGPELSAVAAALQAVTADIPSLFPEGTDFGETEAKPEIWSDSAGFAEKSKEAADAAAAFAEAVESGDKKMMLGAFKAVGDSCKGCHEAYRTD
ncbi:MAG: cytochrome c [Thiohalocapsa sp.]